MMSGLGTRLRSSVISVLWTDIFGFLQQVDTDCELLKKTGLTLIFSEVTSLRKYLLQNRQVILM